MIRKAISKALRFRILARDGFKCRYCGAAAPDAELRVDHVIALADGGHSGETNLVTACADCNAGKSDRRLSALPAAIATVVNRRGRKVPATDSRNRSPQLVKAGDPRHHVLNTSAVLHCGEIEHGLQRVEVWCESHQRYEEHRVQQHMVGKVGSLVIEDHLPPCAARPTSPLNGAGWDE